MGRKVYLSDLEIKLLSGIMASVDASEMEEKEAKALSKLALKFHNWNMEVKTS